VIDISNAPSLEAALAILSPDSKELP